eukprot:12631-Rhodomonas_salina.1
MPATWRLAGGRRREDEERKQEKRTRGLGEDEGQEELNAGELASEAASTKEERARRRRSVRLVPARRGSSRGLRGGRGGAPSGSRSAACSRLPQ